MSNYLRFESSLSPASRELATIATAREKDCPYVWAAHAPAASREGVSDRTIEAVGNREDVETLPASDRDIVDYTREILRAHRTSQALFDRLRDQYGIPWLVDSRR